MAVDRFRRAKVAHLTGGLRNEFARNQKQFLPGSVYWCYKIHKASEMHSSFARRQLISALALASCFSFSACQPQQVILSPAENDLVVLNGCVISACNYLAVVETQHRLEPNFWARILLVRYKDHPAGHAYCVWETDGTIYGYDRNAGSFPIPTYTREAGLIARALAVGLSKSLNEQLTVAQAEFVEPHSSTLYKF